MTGRLDPRSGWTASGCTIAKALDLLSTRSAFLLLREAFYGATRFDEFAERVGISEPVAAARLRDLVVLARDQGLLAREDYQEPGQRSRLEYRLTDVGRSLQPVLTALKDWGDKHLADDRGVPVVSRHLDCGAAVHAELVCEAGHTVGGREIRPEVRIP